MASELTKDQVPQAVLKLLLQLPDQLKGFWWTSKELREFIDVSGVEGIPEEIILLALQFERKGLIA